MERIYAPGEYKTVAILMQELLKSFTSLIHFHLRTCNNKYRFLWRGITHSASWVASSPVLIQLKLKKRILNAKAAQKLQLARLYLKRGSKRILFGTVLSRRKRSINFLRVEKFSTCSSAFSTKNRLNSYRTRNLVLSSNLVIDLNR